MKRTISHRVWSGRNVDHVEVDGSREWVFYCDNCPTVTDNLTEDGALKAATYHECTKELCPA